MKDDKHRMAKRMKLAGRIIGLGTVGFVLTFLIGETAMEFRVVGMAAISAEVVIMGVISGIALAGCILSWWRLHPAGILLIVGAVLQGTGIPPLPALIPQDARVWAILGLPYLVSGLLFLNSWRLSREVKRA